MSESKPSGETGVEVFGFDFPSHYKDALYSSRLERFATAEERADYLIKTIRHMADRIKRKDKDWIERLRLAEHERDIAVRRLAKAREKMKRLHLWIQNS